MSQLFDSTIDVRSTPPSYKEGAQYVDPETGALFVGFDNGAGGDWHPVPPIRVTQEAATFTESSISLTHTNTEASGGSIQLPTYEFIDGFEDNDINIGTSDWTGWSGDTANLTAQSTTVLAGSYSGELTSSGSYIQVSATRSSETTDNFKGSFQANNQTSSYADKVTFNFEDSGGTSIGRLKFFDDGTVYWSSTQLGTYSWSAGTQYDFEVNFDFSAESVEIIINGTSFTKNFDSSASGWSDLIIYNDCNNSGESRTLWFDQDTGISPTTGDAIIEFSQPSDIQAWDLATFQRTLDGETVTVDVEDGAGNVIEADISHNFDISNVATSKDVRLHVYLSRSSTANNPTLDYCARRYVR